MSLLQLNHVANHPLPLAKELFWATTASSGTPRASHTLPRHVGSSGSRMGRRPFEPAGPMSPTGESLPSPLIWTKYVPELPGAPRASPGAPGAAHVLPHHVRSSGSRMGQSPPGAPGDLGCARARRYIPLVNRPHSSGAAEDLRLDRIGIATKKKRFFSKSPEPPRTAPNRPQRVPEVPRAKRAALWRPWGPREPRGGGRARGVRDVTNVRTNIRPVWKGYKTLSESLRFHF